MATLVEAPRAAHNVTSTRPRAVVPIIPVIPRSLQTKRKIQPVLKPLTITDSVKDAACSSKQSVDQEGGSPPTLEGSAPGAYLNGDVEAQRTDGGPEPVDNIENNAMNPSETATGCKSTAFAFHLTTQTFPPKSVFLLGIEGLRFKSDQDRPVGHDINCEPPFDQASCVMPAPFHPANHFPVFSSMASPTFPPGPGITHITPPHSHESSGNIVFGGFPGSAGPSPVLPPSPSTMSFLPRHFPNWAPPQSLQHFPNPHLQHVHGPHPSWHGHFSHFAHPQPYAFPPGYYHQMPSFFPPDNLFPYTPPPGTPFVKSFHHVPQPNGASFSNSSIGSDSVSASEDLNALHPAHHTDSISYAGPNGVSKQGASQARAVADDEETQRSHSRNNTRLHVDSAAQQNGKANTLELGNVYNYLLSQFNCKALSDCCLRVSHSQNIFKAMSFDLHRLLITRSPLLASLISSAGADADGSKQIHLELTGNFVRPDAFELALLHLYGEPLLDYEYLVAREFAHPAISTTTLDKSHTMADCLEFAIGYAAAGDILQIPGVKRRGDDLASRLISWDTLERGLTLAMKGRRAMEKPAANLAQPSSYAPSRKSSASSRASQNSAIRIPCDASGTDEPNPAHDIHDGLLRDISQYIGTHFPTDFQLQTLTPSLPIIDRLPTTAESRTFSPHLSSIQFGDHPSEEAERPNLRSVTLSRILLSVPFPVLQLIFERLSPDTQAQHARSIIEERERRRDRTLRSKSVPWASRLAGGAQWHEVGWEEFVGLMPTAVGRNVRLARRWTGLWRPTRVRARRV